VRSLDWRRATAISLGAAGLNVAVVLYGRAPWREDGQEAPGRAADHSRQGTPAAHLPSEGQRLQQFASLAPQWDGMLNELDPAKDSVKYRKALLMKARGDVLEVAVGTGQCFQCLLPERVTSYVGVDLVSAMLEAARAKLEGLGFPARVERADMHSLPFADASFDTVFGTQCLCSSEQPQQALAEMARVCRPGGRVLLLEHGLAASTPLRWVQQFWGIHPNPRHVWDFGCYDDRDPEALVRASPLKVASVETLGNVYIIVARCRAREADAVAKT